MSSNIVKSAVLIPLLFTYLNGYAQAQSSAPAIIAADQELKSVTAGTVDTIPLKLDPSITGGDLIHVMFADPSLTISLVLPSGVVVNAANASSLGYEWERTEHVLRNPREAPKSKTRPAGN
jgi:hypothetical protein